MAVKKETLSGGELLTRLQRWLRLGYLEEHNILGGWDLRGRRIKGRFYTTTHAHGLPYARFDDEECGPFPPGSMMIDIASTLLRVGLDKDEKWPRAMFSPPKSMNHIVMDICSIIMDNCSQNDVDAWGRYSRLQTVEAWARQKRVKVEFFVNNKKDHSTVVVTFGQYERREDAALFPSPEMVANLALALDVAGVDSK